MADEGMSTGLASTGLCTHLDGGPARRELRTAPGFALPRVVRVASKPFELVDDMFVLHECQSAAVAEDLVQQHLRPAGGRV
jgi:hypothetical protein